MKKASWLAETLLKFVNKGPNNSNTATEKMKAHSHVRFRTLKKHRSPVRFQLEGKRNNVRVVKSDEQINLKIKYQH
jgi:hypothetical protein